MADRDKPLVLVTGLNGVVGTAFHGHKKDKYRWVALTRRDTPGIRTVRADIADLEAIRPAFEGVDVVVHLAADPRLDAPWKSLLKSNIEGTYNVLEAAKDASVKRVVIASSSAAVSGREMQEPYRALVEGRYEAAGTHWPMLTHETSPHPRGLYGVTKIFSESLGHYYADTTLMSVICVRIGAVGDSDCDLPCTPAHFANWCSRRDIAQMLDLCVSAPLTVHFDIFFATSENKWSYRDITHAREVLGYAPLDRAEDYRGCEPGPGWERYRAERNPGWSPQRP